MDAKGIKGLLHSVMDKMKMQVEREKFLEKQEF